MGRGSEDINEGFHYSDGQDDPFWGCQLVSFLGQSSAYSVGPQTKFYGNKYGNKKELNNMVVHLQMLTWVLPLWVLKFSKAQVNAEFSV